MFGQVGIWLVVLSQVRKMTIGQSTAVAEERLDAESVSKTFARCRGRLGRPSWLCDPDRMFEFSEFKQEIESALWRMQTDTPCYCLNEVLCQRFSDIPIQSGVVAALLVLSSGDLPDDIERQASEVYAEAWLTPGHWPVNETEDQLNGTVCDNGLLLVYAAETRTLYVKFGGAIRPVFDYLPSPRRRMDPHALPGYLRGMLNVLQNNRNWHNPMPAAAAVAGGGGGGGAAADWRAVAGMAASAVLVVATAAALLVISCGSGRHRGDVDGDPIKGQRLTGKRLRRLRAVRRYRAKQLLQPDWPRRVEEARRRVEQRRRKGQRSDVKGNEVELADTEGGGGPIWASSTVTTTAAPVPLTGAPHHHHHHQYYYNNQLTSPQTEAEMMETFAPYYIVSEPGSVCGSYAALPQSRLDNEKIYSNYWTLRAEDLRHVPPARETQRCDFYFKEEQ